MTGVKSSKSRNKYNSAISEFYISTDGKHIILSPLSEYQHYMYH